MLSDRDIRRSIDAGDIVITPLDGTLIQPASVDVRLDRRFRTFPNARHPFIRAQDPPGDLTDLVEVPEGEDFILHPGEFVLAATLERIHISGNLAARLEGKSSMGRIGLMIHSTAGFIDPGFNGDITLELSNVARIPIALTPGMKIGQLSFLRLSSPCQFPYGSPRLGSRYQGQRGPTASRPSQEPAETIDDTHHRHCLPRQPAAR